MNSHPTSVTKRRIAVSALVFCTALTCGSACTAETFKKLSSAQIKARFAGMEFTDQVHWVETYGADGRVTSREMGKTRIGKWDVDGDQLCVDVGESGGSDCREVWISGKNVELRGVGGSGVPMQGILERPTNTPSLSDKVKK